VYAVNDAMIADLESGRYGEHASNLGAPIAREIAAEAGCPSFIVDPVVVDELVPASRLSGHPALPRRSVFHALNQRSVARLVAHRIGMSYEEANLIVAHLGGGISVGAHKHGRVVDVNNALDGEGPFTPERTGTLPAGPLVTLCFRGGYSEEEVRRMIKGRGGLMAYLGTTDFRILESRLASGDRRARTVFDAMVVQIAKEISSHGATMEGKVDAVVLTGGMVKSATLVEALRSRLEWMAPVEVVPGEREMEALAEGALAALLNERPVKEYHR
jgi:butyrate kinase